MNSKHTEKASEGRVSLKVIGLDRDRHFGFLPARTRKHGTRETHRTDTQIERRK